ncbi:MAG TPA: glycosyltransferase [Tepidisphaeraceae bacterium]|nr:glycosyltransferase [Tepidisphaeraceae bacterium]
MANESALNICIVTADIVGPVRNGGIGTWYHALATALADAGHRITVLYTLGEWCENKTLEHWVDWYGQKRINFVPLPAYPDAILDASLWLQVTYRVYQWLKCRERSGEIFDVIHFHEWRGSGYYPALARRQGLALGKSVICVGTHSPLLWHKFGMGEFITELEELQTDFQERQSVELADVVVSPSQYMLNWITEQGWKLPARVEIRQYIQSHVAATENASPSHPIRQIVFFGRLETRKGLALFCDAIDILAADPSRLPLDFSVAFLGKPGIVDGAEAPAFIAQHAAKWPFKWSIVDSLDHAGAIEYLRHPGRLAAICSLLENSPNTVLECLVNQIPCLATNVGGTPELIAESDRQRITFEPNAKALCKKILAATAEDFSPAQPAIPPEQTRHEWLDWHRRIVTEITPPAPVVSDDPLVSVCLVHRNRPKYLEQAVESLRRQDCPNFEVVLVDDGSDDAEAIALLDQLSAEFAEKNWRIVRQENRYLGAARNSGARHARGDYLIFMDDDNIAKPNQISTFVRAARFSGADILTCALDNFSGPDRPAEGNPQTHRWLPLGGAINVSVFTNLVGDANGLVRKSSFLALGGFTEDFGIGHEDWELFNKAILKGYKVQPVPESLYFYRIATGSMLRTTNGFANHMRSLRPYLADTPRLRTTLEYTLSMFMLLARRTTDAATLYDRCLAYEAQLAAKSAEILAKSARIDQLIVAHDQAMNRAFTAEAHFAAAQARFLAAEATLAQMHAKQEADRVISQAIVDSYWNSLSWRCTSPLRNTLRRLRGLPPQQRPIIHNRAEADQVIDSIRNSLSWEALAAPRIVLKIINKLRGK